MPIELETTDDFYRNELVDLIYALETVEDLNEIDKKTPFYRNFNPTDKEINNKLKKLKYDLGIDENKNKNIKIKYILEDVEVEKTGDEFKSRIEFLEEALKEVL